MPGSYIIDMRHFVPKDPNTPLPVPVARMRDFLGRVVRAATATPQSEFISGIACRRRPRNRPCAGSIAVRKTDSPEPFVFWECTQCGDNGRITGFEGSPYDLRALSKRHLGEVRIREIILAVEEYRSWISGDMVAYDLESIRTIYSAVMTERGVVISGSDDELDALLDSTAADLNHERIQKRKDNLHSIYDKLGGLTRPKVKRRVSRRSPRPSSDPGSAYAHGFFSAIVAGPMVMPTRWLQRFLSPKHESIEELNACAQQVMNACNEIADRLLRQRDRFGDATLEIARQDAKGNALVEWQRGFVDAMDLSPNEWTTFLSSLPRKDLLAPLAMIAQFSEEPSRREWLADQDLRENLGRSLAVMTVRLWEAYREQPSAQLEFEDAGELRREPPVSRNAPCPCGSGKKYKRCCGSALRAV